MILKQKEIFNKLGDKNSKEMTELNNEVSPDDLKYRYKSSTADTKCNNLMMLVVLYMKYGKVKQAYLMSKKT